ncbi:hypothetical protein DdX_15049 [Ditylenchus destructor]|uniref:Uncharacterized protein n=1 Tax=Ditylenchus destructor TaxID=166010 RepID=A0AAD4MS75_9BILA|nr:hypothetical protein DdX_15049 [Ditylenchus destructor]
MSRIFPYNLAQSSNCDDDPYKAVHLTNISLRLWLKVAKSRIEVFLQGSSHELLIDTPFARINSSSSYKMNCQRLCKLELEVTTSRFGANNCGNRVYISYALKSASIQHSVANV